MSDRVDDNAWRQEDSIAIDSYYEANAMIGDRRRLALDVALRKRRGKRDSVGQFTVDPRPHGICPITPAQSGTV